MEQGVGTGSREELTFLSVMLWITGVLPALSVEVLSGDVFRCGGLPSNLLLNGSCISDSFPTLTSWLCRQPQCLPLRLQSNHSTVLACSINHSF